MPKNAVFFKNSHVAQKIWSKYGLYNDLVELIFFFESPFENPSSAPGFITVFCFPFSVLRQLFSVL